MRNLLAWFDARRRVAALALLGLLALVVLSAGRTPEADEWMRIPDLGNFLLALLGLVSLVGLVLVVIVRPTARGRRHPTELRPLLAVLLLIVVVAAAMWLDPPELAVVEPTVAGQQQSGSAGDPVAGTGIAAEASGTDLAVLALIVVAIATVVVRSLRRAAVSPPAPAPSEDQELAADLEKAMVRAHRHLTDEPDPRTAVLLAYASLEQTLADGGHQRHPAETPTEHIDRVLVVVPVLAAPALVLGRLYELARFSYQTITESQRREAIASLDRAIDVLAVDRTRRA